MQGGSALSFVYTHAGDSNDDFGWLEVKLTGTQFGGTGGFWIQWQEFAELGTELAAYPIKAPIIYERGYELCIGKDLIVRLAFSQLNARGQVAVDVVLADMHDTDQRVTARMLTGYADIASFSAQLRKITEKINFTAELFGQ